MINEVIASYLSGNATPEDIEFLEKWVKESPANRELWNQMRETWISSSLLTSKDQYNYLKAYNKIIQTDSVRIKNKAVTTLRKISWSYYKVASLFILMLFIGGLSAYFITRNFYSKQVSGTYYFEAPIGSRAITILPDGTKVWLNAGSNLKYTSDYNKKVREVKLRGEAFFHVTTNPAKPFLVETGNLTIKATGTSFNVKAYPNEKLITTTLVEGKIELLGKGTHNEKFSYNVKPRQKVTYYNDGILFSSKHSQVSKAPKETTSSEQKEYDEIPIPEKAPLVTNTNVKTELYTSWKDERWLIESEKLSDLAVLLERRYNVQIVFLNDELKNRRFSGTIQNETVEQIFEIMRLSIPTISYIVEKGKITLTTNKKYKNLYRYTYQKE